jgi:hypothetical protein
VSAIYPFNISAHIFNLAISFNSSLANFISVLHVTHGAYMVTHLPPARVQPSAAFTGFTVYFLATLVDMFAI